MLAPTCMLLTLLAQAEPQYRVEVGSVGVAYAGKTSDELHVVFPASTAKGLEAWAGAKDYKSTTPIALDGDLVFFDDKGQLGRVLAPKPAAAKFWCENDGGMQFRPELTVIAKLKRKVMPRKELQNLIAFVAVVPKDQKAPFKLKGVEWPATSDTRAMDGHFDGDKKPEAVIYTAQDQARNCDGEPKNNLTVSLVAGNGGGELRCCGP